MYNYDDEYNWERRSPHSRKNTMATAALVLGVLSIFLCSVFYVSLPCGALAVICAILSRDNRPMVGKSKAGVICGVIGMVITLVFTVSAFRYVLTTDEGREYLQYYYRLYTGDYDFDVDEAFEELFPFLYNSDESNQEDSQENDNGFGSNSGDDSEYGNHSDDIYNDTQPDDDNSGGSDRSNGGSNSSGSDGEGDFI